MAGQDPRASEFKSGAAVELDGLLSALAGEVDWSQSPLGPVESWPQSLKTTVGLIMPAEVQIVLFWGPEFVALYNHAYAPTIGDKHPRALGRPAKESWTELWDDLGPLLQGVRDTGRTLTAKDRPFYIERHGYPETVYFDISYSAVPDESGGVGGVLCIVRETTNQVLADQRNLADRERFEQMFEQSPTFIAMLRGRDHTYEMANPAYLRLIGFRPGIIGKPISDVLPELKGQGFFDLLDEVYGSGEPHVGFGTRVHISHQTGQPPEDRFVDFVYQPLKDAAGKVTGILVQGSDVTDRKRVELALGDSEQRFRRVFEGASVGMIEIDSSWRILSSNPAYREITGYSADDLAGMDCLAFTHSDDIERSRTQLDRLAESGDRVSFEKRYVRKDGSVVWIRSNIARIGDGSRLLKIVEDISERRRAEDALEAERSYLETLNRAGSALAGELDLQRVVQMVTDAGVELTGAQFGAFFYNVTNAAGESYMLYTLSGADRSQFERFGMPRNTQVFGPTFAGEGTVRSDDITADPRYGHNAPHHGMPKGHLPVVSYLAVSVASRTGEVIGGLFFGHPERGRFSDRHERLIEGLAAQAAIAIDNARLFGEAQREIEQRVKAEQALTVLNETLESRVVEEIERRSQAEEALRQAQKMETVGQLSGGIAHDFNNLLQIIQGNLTMLRHALPADQPKWNRFVANALTGTERAAALTQRLLAFSRRQPLDAKPVDVNVMILEMGELIHRTIGETIQIETALDHGLSAAQVDENQLENAILNLAINARDAMPGGGRLRIETSSAQVDERYAALHPEAAPGAYVRVAVSDTGTGMSPEVLARAVEPFFTTKEVGQGTGLGLSMVYGFVRQSGGHVNIRSVEGEGTTIELFLPRAADEPQQESGNGRAERLRRGRGETILVCEDDADVRDFSTTTLRDLGYQVLEARDAAEALAVLEQQEDVDLLFTDVVLPGGTNGAELARAARRLRPALKVLLTTGYARTALDDSDGTATPELISKPFSVERLGTRLRQLLD